MELCEYVRTSRRWDGREWEHCRKTKRRKRNTSHRKNIVQGKRRKMERKGECGAKGMSETHLDIRGGIDFG